MKKIILLTLFFIHFSYCQSITYEYSSIGEYEYNELTKSYKLIENSFEKTKSKITLNENEKTIIVSRMFIPTIGKPEQTLEKYYYIEKEFIGKNYFFYGVDLVNKKYLEFVINYENTHIAENCNGFNGCKKVTTFKR